MSFLSKDAVKNLECLRDRYVNMCSNRTKLRPRFLAIDKSIARETDGTRTGQETKIAGASGDVRVIPNQEVPVTSSQVDSVHAYLTGIFCTGYPIISCATTDRSKVDVGTQVTALCKEDQDKFEWQANVMGCLLDVVKYELCAAEVEWKTREVHGVKSQITTGKPDTTVVTSIDYQGNSIKRLDVYNLVFDPTVDPSEVHKKGVFAGYIECVSYIQVKELLAGLDKVYAIYSNYNAALDGMRSTNDYYRPTVRKDTGNYQPNDWSVFWGTNSRNARTANEIKFLGKYEIFTCYTRIIPKEFDIKSSKSGSVSIWKLVWVNNVLVYAEPLNNAHSYLPIIISTGASDNLGLQTKSIAENVMPIQQGVTSLLNGTLDAMRRAVADRALYDPTRIKSAHINSPTPISKIPVTMTGIQKDFSSAYQRIDFSDTVTPNLLNNYNVVMSMNQMATGLNPVSQGNFVKGNKTNDQFMETMDKSDARLMKFAINIDNSFFGGVKAILRANYMQYSAATQLTNPEDGQPVQIEPEKIRQEIWQFAMADGLKPVDVLVDSQTMSLAVQSINSSPELAMEYDTGAMMLDYLKQRGFKVGQYKRSAEEQQAYVERTRAIASAGQPTNPTGTA